MSVISEQTVGRPHVTTYMYNSCCNLRPGSCKILRFLVNYTYITPGNRKNDTTPCSTLQRSRTGSYNIGDFTTKKFAHPLTRSTIMYWAQDRTCASALCSKYGVRTHFGRGTNFLMRNFSPIGTNSFLHRSVRVSFFSFFLFTLNHGHSGATAQLSSNVSNGQHAYWPT